MPTQLAIVNGRAPVTAMPSTPAPTTQTTGGMVDVSVTANGGRIAGLHAPSGLPPTALTTLDAEGYTVLPGFVDVHIHGSDGVDVMDASPAGLATLASFLATHGVTSFLATTMTAPHDAIRNAVAAVATYMANPSAGARILGVHVEGPYISPHFPGAQPASLIRPPNLTEFAELLAAGPVRMITLAPEAPGAHALIRAAVAVGITVALGHTNASYEECQAASALGVRQATHTYNAMRGLHHREPGALGAVLSNDALYAQLIADFVHVHPAGIQILARCKGVERMVLITDAMRAAGLGPGDYELGGQPVKVADGECRLADGVLAGSILTMDQALRNFIAATGLSLAEAWPVSSRTPAHSIGFGAEVGTLTPGAYADLVLLDARLQVVATVVAGEIVYLRDAERKTQTMMTA
ncbi:MAG: N-acetylglucosamine-6-phosphate deacetylase [Caldilineaceae bacterium]|nr:N-acetylglucosamine-6-phosphate deacetylase [Caldilineaceae bacterium]